MYAFWSIPHSRALVLYIAGAGVAHPERELSLTELQELFPQSVKNQLSSFYRKHYSSLPAEYIKTTTNENPMLAEARASDTPSTLGARAALSALAQAGVSIDQIGLILAGTSTPLETCPSEAQRIGKILGAKIAAFDISAGSLDIFEQLRSLANWKLDLIPEYVLCISTNTLSQRVHYSSSTSGDIFGAAAFGDLACALVVSTKSHRALAQIKAFSTPLLRRRISCLEFDVHYSMKFQEESARDWALREDAEALESLPQSLPARYYFASALFPEISRAHAGRFAPQAELLDSGERYGFAMGASPLAFLADRSIFHPALGDQILIEFAGLGQSSAALSIEWCAEREK
jgi:3-oxoacyl-[acyl-carrier-protein] synthase-3